MHGETVKLKNVGVWIMYRDTVVMYTLVILNVHLLVMIKILKNVLQFFFVYDYTVTL